MHDDLFGGYNLVFLVPNPLFLLRKVSGPRRRAYLLPDILLYLLSLSVRCSRPRFVNKFSSPPLSNFDLVTVLILSLTARITPAGQTVEYRNSYEEAKLKQHCFCMGRDCRPPIGPDPFVTLGSYNHGSSSASFDFQRGNIF